MFLFSGISFACVALGFLVIDKDEPSKEENKRVDWIGAFLITSGLILIVFVLSDLPTARKGWGNPREFSAVHITFPPYVLRSCHWTLRRWHYSRLAICLLAALLGAEA
jgi:hypothetical protein